MVTMDLNYFAFKSLNSKRSSLDIILLNLRHSSTIVRLRLNVQTFWPCLLRSLLLGTISITK